MTIGNLISTLSEKAVITSLNSTNLLVFDRNELKVYIGFTKYGNSVEYVKEVNLKLSEEISTRSDVTDIIVSNNGNYIILFGSRCQIVVRLSPEVLTARGDRLRAEYLCESYPLHDSFLMQNNGFYVIQTRFLSQKVNNCTIVGVLYSDNCIRFYDIGRKRDSLLLVLDFRPFVYESSADFTENKTNTFGLQKNIVSFDFKPPTENAASFSILVIDSDAEFYSSTIFPSYFTQAVTPRIERIESVEGIPCDPLNLQYVETTGKEIFGIFVLLSGGCVLTHFITIPNELGSISLLVNDQIQVSQSTGEPRLLPNDYSQKYQRNKYDLATSSALFSINISSWVEDLLSPNNASTTAKQSVVYEILNVVTEELNTKKAKNALKAVSLCLRNGENSENELIEENNEMFSEENEIMHLVVINNDGEQSHMMAISMFNSTAEKHTEDEVRKNVESGSKLLSKIKYESLETMLSQIKPAARLVLDTKLSEDDAITAALNFLETSEKSLQHHRKIAASALERCSDIQMNAKVLGEKQQTIDERLINETKTVEELKTSIYELKTRMEAARKSINVLVSRIEDNAPLSDCEVRMFDRLKHHQNVLSQLSFRIPKIALDLNEQRRVAQSYQIMKTSKQPNKFANIEKNNSEIKHLEERIVNLASELNNTSA